MAHACSAFFCGGYVERGRSREACMRDIGSGGPERVVRVVRV